MSRINLLVFVTSAIACNYSQVHAEDALLEGRYAIFDTNTSELVPFNEGSLSAS